MGGNVGAVIRHCIVAQKQVVGINAHLEIAVLRNLVQMANVAQRRDG
jgi:hypothetical protein